MSLSTAVKPLTGPPTTVAAATDAVFSSARCDACYEVDGEVAAVKLPCGRHSYCSSCLAMAFHSATTAGAAALPPKCCGVALGENLARGNLLLSGSDFAKYRMAVLEARTPAADGMFCPGCSQFIVVKDKPRLFKCTGPTCIQLLCGTCKALAHPDEPCPAAPTAADSQLAALAAENEWQTCPGCAAIVELIEGCNHISCRCGWEFCYACGRDLNGGEGSCKITCSDGGDY